MNGRSGLATFFLFMFLAVMILLQVLSMIQSDRLYERLNVLLDRLQESTATVRVTQTKTTPTRADLPIQEYPGDEGDWLIWHLTGEPATLNDYHTSSTMPTSYIVYLNIFESLLAYDIDKFNLKASLAQSYNVSDDGLQIDFVIRDDVRFSDGYPITANDVVFTYETVMNPGVDAADRRLYYNNIKEVIKTGERTVRFIMKEVHFKSLEYTGLMSILPKHIYEFEDSDEFNKRISNPMGSGPYIFEKWNVGNEVVLRVNENYWGPKPKIKKIVYKFITNDTAALQAFRAGDIDFMEPLPDQYADLSKDNEFL